MAHLDAGQRVGLVRDGAGVESEVFDLAPSRAVSFVRDYDPRAVTVCSLRREQGLGLVNELWLGDDYWCTRAARPGSRVPM